jgi:hypothetical protein
MRIACLWTECAWSPQWSSQHVASQRFLPELWGSRTRSPRFVHDSGAHRKFVTVHIWKGLCASWIHHADECCDPSRRWRGGAYSALSAMAIFRNETNNISAQNSNDIDGRCSESNLVSFLREKISKSQMLIAFAQMLIACWSAYISLAQNKNRWLQKFVEVKKNLAGPDE